ncbi:zinc finger protein 316 [Trichonephila clavipes]|nr:zinc finger protein 316 [Trichonephila clavipes]
MENRCDTCNLEFPDFFHLLHHECKLIDPNYVKQVCNDLSECSHAFNLFKSSNEGDAGNIPQNEEDNQCMLTETSAKAVSQIKDFLKYNENQSCKETPNGKSVTKPILNESEYCSQVQTFTDEKNPDFNLNQLSTSQRARQISENIVQISSIPPSVSCRRSSFQSINSGSNPYRDKNQQSVSAEYNPMGYCDIGTNHKCEASDPVLKNANECKQEYNSSSPLSMSHKHINLNLEKYSTMHSGNFNSFAGSNVMYKESEPEGNECFLQKNTFDTFDKVCGREDRVKTSTSYSSLANTSNLNAGENSFNQYPNIENNPVSRDRERSYRCGMCKKIFLDYNALSKHYCDVSEKKQHKCDVCGKEFRSNSHLTEHYRSHSDERPYGCEKCSKRFKRINHLKVHSSTHSTEMLHVCEKCNKRFKRKDALTRHYSTHITENSHVCEKCNKRFKSELYLKKHFTTHTTEKPHVCEKCNMRFKRKHGLKQHSSVHDTEKPYVCGTCGKGYTRKHQIKVHRCVPMNT